MNPFSDMANLLTTFTAPPPPAATPGRAGRTPRHALLTEAVTWHPVTDLLPDADLTVLVATEGCEEPTWLGYLDGDVWRDVDGLEIKVTHWSQMLQGPNA